MPLTRNPSPRRRELRRNLARSSRNLPTWLTGKVVAWAAGYMVALALIGTLIAPPLKMPAHYIEGYTLRQAVVPRVQFTAIDNAETALRRDEAFHRKPAIYIRNESFFQTVSIGLTNLINLGAEEGIESVEQLPVATVSQLTLSNPVLHYLKRINHNAQQREMWDRTVNQFINERLPNVVLLDDDEFDMEMAPSDRAPSIVIKHPTDGEVPLADNFGYYKVSDLSPIRSNVTIMVNQFPTILQKTVIAIVMDTIQPTYFRDEQQTQARRQAAYDAVKELERSYGSDSVLFKAGHKLTAVDVELLQKEHAAFVHHLGSNRKWLMQFSHFALMLLVSAWVWVYILAYNRQISRNPVRGVAITLLLLLCQAAAVYGAGYQPKFLFAIATFPTLLVAIVLAITYDQRFALAIASIHAVLVTVSLHLPVGFAVMLLVGVALAAALLNEVRNRSKLVLTGLWVGGGMALTALVTGALGGDLAYDEGTRQIITQSIWAMCSGAAVGVCVQGILPGVERLFNVTTSMRLKELNEANLPLLRRLAEEAPGTYQHSLRIADMGEGAADAIGADGLLCRVGAMYHDIGKINKPMYFIENQGGGPNRHTKLSPAMSLLIIVGHVKDGVEMAREYGLPPAIRHFIESHHGTTLVEYFYHAAKQQNKEAQDEKEPTEFNFRYPGPKPQTKEAAIIMLCDGIEGAARSLPEPTPVRLEQLVRAMANKRLMDGQFDECNLTLAELHKIEQSIIKTLNAMYHGRVAYPKDEEESKPQPATGAAAS